MAELTWDQVGERLYETGVDHGVLYIPDAGGAYANGYAWNGLTTITESPSGAEATPQYADNIKYLNLVSAEEFGATIEAFTYPDEFEQCDGTAAPVSGVSVSQQTRKQFGLSYRSLLGNDVEGTDFGYKLHLVYSALAAPSEKARATVNDSPEAAAFSWELTTTPVAVSGTNPVTGKPFKPTAHLSINSTKVDPVALASLEAMLYGTEGDDAALPFPGDVIALFSETVTEVTPIAPTAVGDVITIPGTTGVVYTIDGEVVTGTVTITEDTGVHASPATSYKFPPLADTYWFFSAS